MNGKKIIISIILLSLLSLLSLSAACSQTGAMAEVPQITTPSSTQTSADLLDRLNDLEKRITILEQGQDERVIEYNTVLSALWKMIIENKLDDIPGDLLYTNDMREFPSPLAPLHGYDKNGDGIPDTNYLDFEKTAWFYQMGDYFPSLLIQGPDLTLFKDEAYETELHNIQTAVMAMLADSEQGMLDNSSIGINDMDLVTADSGACVLTDYLTGLNADGTVKSGCTYNFYEDGAVTQNRP